MKQDLNKLYYNLNERIEFNDLEGYLGLIIEGDNTGNFRMQVICNDQPGIYSSELRYEICFDQTYIKPLVNLLNEITEQFPVIGDYKNDN